MKPLLILCAGLLVALTSVVAYNGISAREAWRQHAVNKCADSLDWMTKGAKDIAEEANRRDQLRAMCEKDIAARPALYR